MNKIIDFQTSRPIEETSPGRAQKPLNILEMKELPIFARYLDSVIRNGSYNPETFRMGVEYIRFVCSVPDKDALRVYRSLKEAEAAK
jgi:hypothetical protein